jgi:ribosomal protein S18 acetylase RimI-like enzyme
VLVTSLLRVQAGLPQVVRADGRSLRITRWPGDRRAAQVGPVPGEAPPSAELVRATVDDLGEVGFAEVLTTALLRRELEPFVAAGFAERDRLVLLRHVEPLALLRRVRWRPRTARRREWPHLAEIDRRAFPAGWSLDVGGLAEAVSATPRSRVRVAGRPGLGYLVSGRSRRRGFLQRLAVDPEAQRRGIGRALVVDAIAWLAKDGVDEVLVNTQEGNEPALALYQQLGFGRLPEHLLVLGRPAVTQA